MPRHNTAEHSGSSLLPSVTTNNALRNKFNIIGQHLKSKANDLAFWKKSRSMTTEVKLFLFICSIFPNDFRIPFDDLVMFGMGLELFGGVHDMFAARYRVQDIISIINDRKYPNKAVGGIIRLAHEKDGPPDQYVEMLDGAHDLTKSIASSYPSVFRRETVIEKWPESDSYRDCEGLSLVLKKVNQQLVDWECPKIAVLVLKCNQDTQSVPVHFFEGVKQLRVLSLDLPSLPQSLNVLRNLKTLRLKVRTCEDMSSIGGLINLEFLSISTLSLTEIPREMGQLVKLRLLDVRKMNVAYIPPGVFSRMLKLEELYLPSSFIRWGCRAKDRNYDDDDECEIRERDIYDVEGRNNADISEINGDRINASLSEIASLSLNALHICVPKASILPKRLQIFKNIRVFKILTPKSILYEPFGNYSANVLQLTGEASDIKESGICDLSDRVEHLCLTRVQSLKNVIYQLEDNGFPQLKKMIISECEELEYVVDRAKEQIPSKGDSLFRQLECLHLSMLSNLKEICHERWTNFQWFSNLSQVSIRFCPKLKYVFPLSVFRGMKLKSIEILGCIEMVGIFYEDDSEYVPFTLCSIEKLDLHSLPWLISILIHKDNNKFDGVHEDIYEILTTNEGSISESSSTNESFDGNELNFEPRSLTSKEKVQDRVIRQLAFRKQVSIIANDTEIYCVFLSRAVVQWLRNLRSLKVAFCDLIRVIFLFDEKHAISKAFNSLEVLELHCLCNLAHIWFHVPPKISAFKNLQLLVVSECSNLYLFTYRVAKLLVQLQKIYVSRCEKMEEIIAIDDENRRKDRIVLPRLKLLELQHIPNLRILFSGNYEIELPLLESLKLEQCNKVRSICNGLLKMPMLEGVEVNGTFHIITQDHNAIFSRIYSSASVTIPHSFPFVDLKIATKNFSSSNLLGKDSSRVYKGWIDRKTFSPSKTGTGMPVAIKRVDTQIAEHVTDFKYELDIVKNKSHPNVVKLLGHCVEDGEYLLVYEFVPRGKLSDYLFTRNTGIEPLSWDKRIKIAVGVARGLNHLHTLEPKVIHRGIGPDHILLDKDYNAKISGFGLAHEETLGYAKFKSRFGPPGNVEGDVYSFGKVLLELMTGLKAYDHDGRGWVKPMLSRERELKDMMDSTMEGQYSSKAMLLTAKLVLKCTKDDGQSRPTMGEVLEELQQIAAVKDLEK